MQELFVLWVGIASTELCSWAAGCWNSCLINTVIIGGKHRAHLASFLSPPPFHPTIPLKISPHTIQRTGPTYGPTGLCSPFLCITFAIYVPLCKCFWSGTGRNCNVTIKIGIYGFPPCIYGESSAPFHSSRLIQERIQSSGLEGSTNITGKLPVEILPRFCHWNYTVWRSYDEHLSTISSQRYIVLKRSWIKNEMYASLNWA